MKPLSGVIGLIPTPLTKKGELDEKDLKKLIDFQFENGCDGMGVLAGVGEGYLMREADWTKVVKAAVDQVNGRGPLIVGCAAMGTGVAVDYVKKAADIGADAILSFNPIGYRAYTVEETYRHFKTQAEAADVTLVPYARDMDMIHPEVIKRLVDEGYVKHMKYGFHSCSILKQLVTLTGDKLYRFCGADTWTLRYLLIGCHGIMTATAAVFPRENVELLKLVKAGKIRDARELYYRVFLPWNDAGFYENWQWAHKYAFKLLGLMKSDTVVPPQALGEEYHKAEIESLLKYLGKI
ncbi:MAG: dihydrodipicolinate synthase family protein [Candidatus Bathyarchaeia archaeon]|jgi:4-hydroxy-tetrahydrodipicolinate synthase